MISLTLIDLNNQMQSFLEFVITLWSCLRNEEIEKRNELG